MADIEKVIEAFDEAKELVWTDDDEYTVGYNNGLEAGKNIAIALLKEHEAVETTWFEGTPFCGNCGHRLEKKNRNMVGINCPMCKRSVKWE